jgi:hypothetical protein
MYCTYCHKEVKPQHRCDTVVHRTANTIYVSSHRRANSTQPTAMDFDAGWSTIKEHKDE